MIDFILYLDEELGNTLTVVNEYNDIIDTIAINFDISERNNFGNRELMRVCHEFLDKHEMDNTEYRVFIRIH